MPVTYQIDQANRIVFATATGELTAEDIHAYRRQAIADPNFAASFDHLFDFRSITGVRLSTDEIRGLATSSIFDKTARKAHVVPTDNMFGISRMFSILLEAQSNEMQVFRDIDKARRWLGLE